MKCSSVVVITLVSTLATGCAQSATHVDAGMDDGATDALVDASMHDAGDAPDVRDPANWVEPERPDLPPAPPWVPDFPVTGTPGWRASTSPICAPDNGDVERYAIFADATGVYAHVTILNNPFAGQPWGGLPWGNALLFNDGTGWVQRLWAPYVVGSPNDVHVTGSGSIFLSRFGCGVTEILPGPLTAETFRCSFETDSTAWSSLVFDETDHGYLIQSGQLHHKPDEASPWSLASSLPPDPSFRQMRTDLWAIDGFVVGATTNQNAFVFADGTFHDLANAIPAGGYESVFAFSENDLWFGGYPSRLAHYDGATWTLTSVDFACDGSIKNLWGHDDTLFFTTSRSFGRVVDGEVELIVDMPCTVSTDFGQLTGVSQTEVYLTVVDMDYALYECGATFMVWFDGTAFHRF